ncbi:MAG: hypothetical protein KBI47_19950 [Armatimonadetes bacterium]|nr:hypothetical protein [Armatimonadota bacterium]
MQDTIQLKTESPATPIFRRAVTPRAVIAGIIALIATSFIVAWAELVTGTIQIGFLQLPPVLIAILFIFTVLNKLLARISPKLPFTGPELVVIYCMILMSSMITSRGLLEDLIPVQVGLNYYADPASKWEELFFPHVKQWMVPWDVDQGPLQEVSVGFFEGLRPGAAIPWKPWILPTLAWLGLVGLVYAAYFALAAFLQRLWADNELLSFPLVQLPLEMISQEGSRDFLRNKLMWLGFAVPLVIFGLNGLNRIYPAIPSITLQVGINQYLKGKPWSDLGYFTMFFSMAAVGFFYLLPSEILLSLWSFFLLARVQELIASSLGATMSGMPHAGVKLFVGYQTVGAYFGIVAYMLYTSWPRIKTMLRTATGAGSGDDSHEFMPYSTALAVLAVSFAGIIAYCGAAGMSVWVAVVEFGIYLFVQSIIMARSTAEAGMPMTEGSFTPLDVIGIFANKRTLGPRNLTALAFTDCIFTRDLRGMVLTGFLDGQKLGDALHVRRRTLLPVFVFAILAAVAVGFIFHIWLPYRYGGVTMYSYTYRSIPTQFWREHAPFMTGQESFTWSAGIWTAVGIAVSIALNILRRNFVWWPLNPLGYALSAAWTTTVFWFPMLLAWMIKSVITRYGGITGYRRARPIFLGLIFGEFTMAAFWTLISCIFRTQAPFFPWP